MAMASLQLAFFCLTFCTWLFIMVPTLNRESVILRKFYLKYSFNTVSVHRLYLLSITDRFNLIYLQHSCCLLLIWKRNNELYSINLSIQDVLPFPIPNILCNVIGSQLMTSEASANHIVVCRKENQLREVSSAAITRCQSWLVSGSSFWTNIRLAVLKVGTFA